MNYTIRPGSKLEEEKPFTCEDVAENLIVDGIDDEGYIKLHSRRRIRNNIYEQQFYKIHADEVNKIIVPMFTANQAMLPSPVGNKYLND